MGGRDKMWHQDDQDDQDDQAYIIAKPQRKLQEQDSKAIENDVK